MQKLKLLTFQSLLLLVMWTHAFAGEMEVKTAACRMEVKILGSDLLEEDENCLWVVEHTAMLVEKCPHCLADLELIKQASQGYFDYK